MLDLTKQHLFCKTYCLLRHCHPWRLVRVNPCRNDVVNKHLRISFYVEFLTFITFKPRLFGDAFRKGLFDFNAQIDKAAGLTDQIAAALS